MEDPPNSLKREEVTNNDLGRRSPWWGRRKEGVNNNNNTFANPVGWTLIFPACCGNPSLLCKLRLDAHLSSLQCGNLLYFAKSDQLGGVLDPGLDNQRGDHGAAGRPPLLMHC
jgi:hypothetical protein